MFSNYRITYRVIIPLLLALATAVSFYLVFYAPVRPLDIVDQERTAREKEKEERENIEPGISVRRPVISHLVDGEVMWQVYADSISSETRSGITKLLNSNGVFYRNIEDRDLKIEFRAPVTIYAEKEKLVQVRGMVSGTMIPEQYSFEAEYMDWDESSGVLTAGEVTLKSNGSVIRGETLKVNPEEKRLKMSGKLVAEFSVD